MAKEITPRLTKNEILAAYNEAAEQLKAARSQQTRQDKELTDKKEVLRKSKEYTYDEIIRNIAELKLTITGSLDTNEKALIKEFKRLEELSAAVRMEEDNLNELYQIHNEAGTLEALLAAQRIEKDKFDKEMAIKRAQLETEMNDLKTKWERERSLQEQKVKEEQQQVSKDRKREEEEYSYDLKLKRKKETDAYEEKKQLLEKELKDKKAAFEKEISEREAIVAEKEVELATLRKQVEKFPAELEKAVKEAEKRISDQLATQFKHEKELSFKENESLVKLKDQIISSLQLKIKEQEQLIKDLTVKSDKASQQVQDIALKALEGPASIRYALRENFQERKKEE
jgi:hypothetical protein